MRFQFLDAFLDALQRFFFAQDMRDLDRAARSELLAGNGGLLYLGYTILGLCL